MHVQPADPSGLLDEATVRVQPAGPGGLLDEATVCVQPAGPSGLLDEPTVHVQPAGPSGQFDEAAMLDSAAVPDSPAISLTRGRTHLCRIYHQGCTLRLFASFFFQCPPRAEIPGILPLPIDINSTLLLLSSPAVTQSV